MVARRELLAAGAGIAVVALAGAAAAAKTDEATARRLARLRRGVEGVEALRAAKRLQHAFAHYVECGLWREAGELFTADALARTLAGEARGRSAIVAHLRSAFGKDADGPQPGRLHVGLALSPVVTVSADGATAKGRWREVGMWGTFGQAASWTGGIYENTYGREDGVWKIQALDYHPRFAGPYASGWRSTDPGVVVVPFHYDPDGAGVLQPEAEPSAALRSGADLAELHARLRRLAEESEVQNLQNAYGYYVDRKMWDDVADLFAAEGTLELGRNGVFVGPAQVRRGLEAMGPAGLGDNQLNDHAQLCAVVTVAPDGLSARARGFELAMVGVNEQWARWELGVFENAYVKQGGVWKIRGVRVHPRMAADYETGWIAASKLRQEAGPRPDRLSSEASEPYPKACLPAFSYANPATGRPPAYPQGAVVVGRIQARAPAPVRSAHDGRGSLEAAERLLAVVQAYDGPENVSNAYGYYIDEFLWDQCADLFARDGWKELSYVGVYQGRDRIRASMTRRYNGAGRKPGGQMTLHQKTQPVTHPAPDGRSAHIRERLLQMNSQVAGPGSYIGGIYENRAVIEDGVWKIAAMDLDYTWLGDYAGGWEHVKPADNSRFAPPESFIKAMPPDRPLRGVVFAPYPKVAPMGFHYRNPVSARPPAVLLD